MVSGICGLTYVGGSQFKTVLAKSVRPYLKNTEKPKRARA
jgi:hypothetical protein